MKVELNFSDKNYGEIEIINIFVLYGTVIKHFFDLV